MESSHLQTVVDEFSTQAKIWSGAIPSGLTKLVATLGFRPEDHVIDVAAGSCRVSRAIAPLVSKVAAVEITQAMLDHGRQGATEEGLSNLEFHLGPAENLPFEADQFDVAVTRYSFHHFVDAQAVLGEMYRVTKPWGRIIIIDILSPDDDSLAEQYNIHQRLRDPSHTASPKLDDLKMWFANEGLEIRRCHVADESQDLEGWLNLPNLSDGDKAQIRSNVKAEMNGGIPTGLQPFLDGQTVRFRERVVTIIGEKDG